MEEDIEEIELGEDDIQVETIMNVWKKCPKCGAEYYEPNVSYEEEYICECEECGHKFKFNTGCPY